MKSDATRSPNTTVCCGCGVTLQPCDGPTHTYMTSSPACWALYGQVLAREYSDRQLDVVHRLSVDTYAVQHPGDRSPQCIQSVAVHLCRLCVIIEHGYPVERANTVMLQVKRNEGLFRYLERPESVGTLTVADVARADGVAEHRAAVRAWANATWQAWSAHHDVVRSWLPKELASAGHRRPPEAER